MLSILVSRLSTSLYGKSLVFCRDLTVLYPSDMQEHLMLQSQQGIRNCNRDSWIYRWRSSRNFKIHHSIQEQSVVIDDIVGSHNHSAGNGNEVDLVFPYKSNAELDPPVTYGEIRTPVPEDVDEYALSENQRYCVRNTFIWQ